MAFRDPFAAYNAGSNDEAHLVCSVLQDANIEAMVVEDASVVGLWALGPLPEIHKPQVWIERHDIERARQVVLDFEQRKFARRVTAENGNENAAPPIEVVCEECGKRSKFPAVRRGAVESCHHCQAYVDVGDDVEFEGWEQEGHDPSLEET